MTEKQIYAITERYYSCFCDTDLSDLQPGIRFVCTQKRDEIVKGFGCRYAIYLLQKGDRAVIAYAPKYSEFMQSMQGKSFAEILAAVESAHPVSRLHLLVFEREKVFAYGGARLLTRADYPLFEAFFRATNPDADPDGWLFDYFTEKAEKELLSGCFANDRLVSVCDAPDMPYLDGVIQHTGIMTLACERKKGYAKCAAALSTHHLLERGICPQWECDVGNTASRKLAESIGYRSFGEAYIVRE